MSRRYKGGVISATAPTTSTSSATGVWTLPQQMVAQAASAWPFPIVTGSQSFTTAGSFTWVAPAGVTSVSVVAVGSSSTTNAGALAYKNNITVSPGTSYPVVVGTPNVSTRSSFVSDATVSAGPLAQRTGDGGGNGGGGCSGGAGAGGYSGAGGFGANYGAGGSGAGGGGGGGGAVFDGCCTLIGAGGGGGVGLFGEGASGAGGSGSVGADSFGRGGSGGGNGTANLSPGGNGGLFGGGKSVTGSYSQGAVRIVYPGNTRSFPSTCVGAP
jgi:hypothetical protein